MILTAAEVRSEEFREWVRSDLHREMDRLVPRQRFWMLDGRRVPVVAGGTSFSGYEVLCSMATPPGAVGPSLNLSILSTECVQPIQPIYFSKLGNRFEVKAHGTITATATIPTFQITFVAADAYANPLAGHVATLATHTAITPGAAAGTQNWQLDLVMAVRATGAAGTLIAVGKFINEWATAGTFVITPFRNANPPTAVQAPASGGSGLLAPVFFSLNEVLGVATAGNTINCLDYQLASAN
jgi:hypothetical protein